MKLYISSDIEGTAGITHWDETDAAKGGRLYEYFSAQMTREVAAACEGAMSAGVQDILVKDAHDTARNVMPDQLPRNVLLQRGWSGGLFTMVTGLEEGFGALAFTGYHSPAGSCGNPLAHTMCDKIDELIINGVRASEFLMHSYIAGMLQIPVVFLSGDKALCEEAERSIPGITTVAVSEGVGDATVSIHPDLAVERIRTSMQAALAGNWQGCVVPMPDYFETTVRYHKHTDAFWAVQYPGAQKIDEKTISFAAADYRDVLRFYHFVL